MPPPLIAQLTKSWPPEQWHDATLLVAVSGGADSVALLRGLVEVRSAGPGRIVAAHFNHCLRAEESDRDERFVQDLCRHVGIACRAARAGPGRIVAQAPDGIEAAARQARYDFLREIAQECGARYVVTAHTANDQVETILHRVLRGTGIHGLAGISRVRPLTRDISLLRPLLEVSRQQVVAYLNSIPQAYRTDASNEDLSLTRNRLRRTLIPLLMAEFNPQVEEAILRLGNVAAQVQQWIEVEAQTLYDESVEAAGSEVSIDLRRLAAAPAIQVREVLSRIWRAQRWPQQDMTYEKWLALSEMASPQSDTRTMNLPGHISARRSDQFLVLRRS